MMDPFESIGRRFPTKDSGEIMSKNTIEEQRRLAGIRQNEPEFSEERWKRFIDLLVFSMGEDRFGGSQFYRIFEMSFNVFAPPRNTIQRALVDVLQNSSEFKGLIKKYVDAEKARRKAVIDVEGDLY